MSTLTDKIRRTQIEAAEDAVVASIPKVLLDRMKQANVEFAAKGGCSGCASKRIGVHYLPCSYCDAHPFD